MASRSRFGTFVYTVATRVAIRIATRAASGSGPLARTLPPDAPPSAPDHSEPRTSQANNHLSDAEPDKLWPLVGRKDLRPSVRKTLPLVYATRRATLRRDSVKQGDKQVKRVLKSRSCCVCSLSRWGNSGGWCSHRPEIGRFRGDEYGPALYSQAADRAYEDPVFARVAVFAYGGEHHEEGGLARPLGIDSIAKGGEAFRPLLD